MSPPQWIIRPRSPYPRSHTREVAGWEAITVVFWIEDMDEGKEVALEGDVHLTRPDSFNQLRGLLAYLLDERLRGREEFATK